MMCGTDTGTNCNCPTDRVASFSGSEKDPSVIDGEKDAVFVRKKKDLNESGRSTKAMRTTNHSLSPDDNRNMS